MRRSDSGKVVPASIELVQLRKSYGAGFAVRDISLTIEAGEFFTLLGSSGSGKTTTLMMIAGFVEPDGGDILIGGRSILDQPPEKRNLGVVFQSYALFPNMTVAQNVEFPLRMRHVERSAIGKKWRRRCIWLIWNLSSSAGWAIERWTAAARGARARLGLRAPVLLMDEPLGALDRKLREQLQGEIKRIQKALGVTVVYVTRDQDEALVLSDRIAVMADGMIEQMGLAAEFYEKPRSVFVGQFLGDSNLIEGRVAQVDGSRLQIELAGDAGAVWAVATSRTCGDTVRLLIRPESIALATTRRDSINAVPGRVRSIDYLGSSVRYAVETAAGSFVVRVTRLSTTLPFSPKAALFVTWRPEDATVFA
jgi:ABC-type Fe3+/spermidine/putrescine transport system ATPase subunit